MPDRPPTVPCTGCNSRLLAADLHFLDVLGRAWCASCCPIADLNRNAYQTCKDHHPFKKEILAHVQD